MKGVPIQTRTKSSRPSSSSTPTESIWNREIQIGSPFPLKEKQQIYRFLQVLLDSGLGILDALEVLIDQTSKKNIKQLLERLKTQLQSGKSLSEAMALEPRFFTPYEIQSIHMGEEAGKVGTVLVSLSELFEKRLRLKRKLVQAFSYPVTVIFIAVLVLTFMILKVVPMFQDIFKQFDSDLPPLTQTILDLSDSFSKNIGWILLGLLIVVGLVLYVRKLPTFRHLWSQFVLRIPVLGGMIKKLQLSRFSYSLSMLLTAKVKLDQALALLAEAVPFYPIQAAIPKIQQDVVNGKSLYEAFQGHGIFPSFFTQIIRVGERTAQLDTMLASLAKNLEEEAESGLGQLTQLLEPLLIIVLGIMVGGILVAMYLPMFALSGAIG